MNNEAFNRYLEMTEWRNRQGIQRPSPPPPPPTGLELLKSMEWSETKTFRTSSGALGVPQCSYCGGLCDDPNQSHGIIRSFIEALPPKWKGHKEECKFLTDVLPRIAELELTK